MREVSPKLCNDSTLSVNYLLHMLPGSCGGHFEHVPPLGHYLLALPDGLANDAGDEVRGRRPELAVYCTKQAVGLAAGPALGLQFAGQVGVPEREATEVADDTASAR